MAYALYSASAPGSFMISGEHAVLRGELALVGAIDKRITVHLRPRSDAEIVIRSDSLGEFRTNLTRLTVQPPFQFVLATIQYVQEKLVFGFELTIDSELSHVMGLSSSAAVTVATLAVLMRFAGLIKSSKQDLFRIAQAIIRRVQGFGSGADIAAAIFGGILAFRSEPLSIKYVAVGAIPWHLVYTGYKTPTSIVIANVNEKAEQYPLYYQALFQAIGAISEQMLSALENGNLSLLGEWMNRHAALQASMGLVCSRAKAIFEQSMAMPNVHGVKLSGSGLGDCVLVLGELAASDFSTVMNIMIAPQGLIMHGKI